MLINLFLIVGILCFNGVVVRTEIEKNIINKDGPFSFRHSNDDIGGFYHSESATSDNIVRGRYGSRNPSTGKVEEVVYTAGPRGFRANGPKLHRKMDLAQYPTRPRGNSDDSLADPYDDPSYSFSFRYGDQSRSENSDPAGRVGGLYSYLDDVGERHNVRYAAGAGTGFEVLNSVPDNPVSVAYNAPLYKAHSKTRGKMTTQRGPDGTYKLIAAGPDHRRAESRSPDGFVRGTYSYLDDTGVQRTVEYIAGPGIGYRIVKNRMGPGSHINPSITEFRLSDTDFKLSNDFSGNSVLNDDRIESESSSGGTRIGGRDYLNSGKNSGNVQTNDEKRAEKNNSKERAAAQESTNNRVKTDRMGSASSSRGTTRYGVISENTSLNDRDRSNRNRNNNRNTITSDGFNNNNNNRNRDASRGSSNFESPVGRTHNGRVSDAGYKYDTPSSFSDTLDFKDEDLASLPPLITSNNRILQLDRERDWRHHHRDSTIIKNVGKWYIGLPPGHSVRAHVQNIDLLPLGGRRVPSPSEALRQDEIADLITSMESGMSYNS